MTNRQRPKNRFYRWVRFLDRIQCFWHELASKDYIEAAYGLARSKAFKDIKVREKQTSVQFEGVHEDIVKFWKGMYKACKARNIPVIAFEMLRSPERQDELYKAGRSKARGYQSPHQFGMAVDIVHATDYWQITKKQWDIIGSIGFEVARKNKIDIEWGGKFKKFYDPAHWQIKNWCELIEQQPTPEQREGVGEKSPSS